LQAMSDGLHKEEQEMSMLKKLLTLVCVLCFVSAGFALAGPPTEQLKKSIDKIIDLLNNQELKTDRMKLERRNRIFKVMEEQFDFGEMARRSLGGFWQTITESQQKEFEVAFSSLLERSYITKIERYTDEHVVYSNEKPKGEKYYSVRADIVSGSRSIPVEYSLHDVSGQWLVYDVNIEGVSLVTNYRSQFGEVVRKDGFRGLMAKLDEKLKKLGEE
jgi:phospholipid transport system substrate-binding protein